MPKVVATDWTVLVVCYTDYGGRAGVVFWGATEHVFGLPGESNPHPLGELSEPMEVLNSPRARACERQRGCWAFRVEPGRHFVLPFHDSTFECIAPDYQVLPPTDATAKLLDQVVELGRLLDRMRP
jgi:hypothetical protein